MEWFLISFYVIFAVINITSTALAIRKEVNRYGYITRRELVEKVFVGAGCAFVPVLDFVTAIVWGIPSIWEYICEADWMNEPAFDKKRDE